MGVLLRLIGIAFIFLVIVVILVSNIADYVSAKTNIKNVISFKSFKNFYAINPAAWDLQDIFVMYTIKKQGRYDEDYYFRFDFLDLIQYKEFRKQIKKEKEKKSNLLKQQKDCDDYQKVLADIEYNIKLTQKKNEEEMHERLAKIRAEEQL